MLRAIYAITLKEIRVFAADLGSLVTLFVMPLAFIVIFSLALADVYATSPEDNPIAIPISVDGAGALAEQIAAVLDSAEGIDVIRNDADDIPFTAGSLADAVAAGDYQIAVVFPVGFTDALSDSGVLLGGAAAPVTVELVTDPATTLQFIAPIQGAVAGVIQQTLGQMMNVAGAEQLFEMLELPDEARAIARAAMTSGAGAGDFPVTIQRVNPPNVEREILPDSYQQNVPGYTVMFMFFIVTVIATSVFKERNSGALRRVRATPASRVAVVIGKTIPFFAINFLQAVIMFTVARLAFGMNLVNIPALLVITAGLSLAATGMGSLITNVVRTEAQAGSIGVLLVLVLAALSGSMIPRFVMPEAMQTIGAIAPQSWGLTAYQDVLVRGMGIGEIALETAVLVGFGVVFLTVSVFRFRYE
ncbi:MAG: ABC transporter permease [Chloroflexota bacterium]|jgi:ABC-2 type transport system permease protein|nr:ABC transporter permease [Chloroflexota bacterium]MDP6758619.1 ABC transporter permease [Chloroflexota bacterium]